MPDVRLIDANALKRLIKSGDDLIFDPATEREILHMIDYQETIDAQPVKHGRWEETHISLCKWIPEDENEEGHSFYMAELKCSCCERYNVVTFALTLNKPEFCQLCGARMDGDDADS